LYVIVFTVVIHILSCLKCHYLPSKPIRRVKGNQGLLPYYGGLVVRDVARRGSLLLVGIPEGWSGIGDFCTMKGMLSALPLSDCKEQRTLGTKVIRSVAMYYGYLSGLTFAFPYF
jgi:hypothetical protein